MSDQTTVLQLVLNALHMGNSISSIDERIAIQKVVCLTQEAGLQLGYSFNWYVRGPYSPALAADYYQLAAVRQHVEQEAGRFSLTESAVNAVNRVASMLDTPADVPLTRVQWLELLASIVFLVKKYKLDITAANEKIRNSKPLLAPYFERALASIYSSGIGLN